MRSSTARRVLNRLIAVCRDEVMALEAAALTAGGERRRRLEHQVSRRVIFQEDLARAVAALGGVPAEHASRQRRLANALDIARSFFVRSRRVELYEDCARATARTARMYGKALKREGFPNDVRFGLERQRDEIDFDRNELRWLRWGGSLSSSPAAIAPTAAVPT